MPDPRYLLRTTPACGISGGQKLNDGRVALTLTWPTEPGAEVSCVDWDPAPKCGQGIHGYLYGEGRGSQLSDADNAIWQVVEVPEGTDVVQIEGSSGDGKVKTERVVLRYSGTRDAAIAWLVEHAPGHATYGAQLTAGAHGTATAGAHGTATAGARGTATAGDDGTATAGDDGTATAGAHGTATAGAHGTATAGARGTATAGDDGTATAGDDGTATAGDDGTATAGAHGTATAGAHGTATAGYAGTATAGARGTATAGARGTATAGAHGTATAGARGTATAGARGTATAGYAGTATAGARGTATAGDAGTATAGDDGQLRILYWDGKRYRVAVGYIGEGLEAHVPYVVRDGKLVRKDEPTSA